MLQIGGVSAWVSIGENNVEAVEYDVKTVTSPAAYGPEFHAGLTTCWIESRVGEAFSVNWQDTTDGLHFQKARGGYIWLDGVPAGGQIKMVNASTATKNTTSNILISSSAVKPFMFSKLELTDDDEALGKAAAQNIGDIVLEIWEVFYVGSVPVPNMTTQGLPGDEKVHERSKKGSAHRVQFGQVVPQYNASLATVDKLRLRNRITFKYRSIDILRANGIAPPLVVSLPATEPSQAEHNDEDETAEAQRLEARLAVLNARRSNGTVKKEQPREKNISLGVIDLTEDDDNPSSSNGKRKRDESGTVKKEKKPKIKPDPGVHGGFIDLT